MLPADVLAGVDSNIENIPAFFTLNEHYAWQ